MAASTTADLTSSSEEDPNSDPREVSVGGDCDVDVEHVAGASSSQQNRTPFTEIKNCKFESKRTSCNESDNVKPKKYRRIKSVGSGSSQATQESASKAVDSTDSEDDEQLRHPKNKKTRLIFSSTSESSQSTQNKKELIGLSSDSGEDVKTKKIKRTRRISTSESDDDFESSKYDNFLLEATEQIEAGSSDVRVVDKETDDSSARSDSASSDSMIMFIDDDGTEETNGTQVENELENVLATIRNRNRAIPSVHEEQELLTVAKLTEIQKELNSRPEESEEAEQPRLVALPLMPHQLQGLKFMLWRETCPISGGMICDEMGLGKTGIAIALIADQLKFQNEFQLKKKKGRTGKHKGGTLVVAPASLLNQWQQEIKKFCHNKALRVLIFHGADREIRPAKMASKYDVVITTYKLVSQEFESGRALFEIDWDRVILDEAHVIRNCDTAQSTACIKLSGTNRWVVTGTPIQNEEADLYGLIRFLRFVPFDQLPLWNQFLASGSEHDHPRLKTLLDSLMLRRSWEDAGLKRPEERVIEIPLELSTEEQEIHDLFESFSQVVLAKFLEQRLEQMGEKATASDHSYHAQALRKVDQKFLELFRSTQFRQFDIPILLLRLRQITCHPGLILESLPDDDDDRDSDDAGTSTRKPKRNLVLMSLLQRMLEKNDAYPNKDLLKRSNPVFDVTQSSTKMLELIPRLEEKLKKKEKVIVVSSFAGFLKIIEPTLNERNIKYEIFLGSTPTDKRDRIQNAINDKDSDVQVLLLAMRAGGQGLNFTGANHMFILDLHWNPQLEKQVMGRISRFGQMKSVNIVKFICDNTIEKRILAAQERKLEIAENALHQRGKKLSTKLTIGYMMKLFRMDDENYDTTSQSAEDPDEEPLFAEDDNDVDDDDNLARLLGLASN